MKHQTDPLAEKQHEVLPGLIWKYSNRVLVLTTYSCPSSCSFCFRQHLNQARLVRAKIDDITRFILSHDDIKEVIFSGGEPLVKADDMVEIIQHLKNSQVKVFRIHTRLPVTFPLRIPLKYLAPLPGLIEQPVFMVLHTNHPKELIKTEVRRAIKSLRQAGFILLSHSVFLKGINDSVEILADLFTKLVELGVKPYYIFHCDHMEHTEKFEVPVSKEVRIMTELRKQVSGLAYPLHVIDSLSGQGKIPVPTNYWQWSGTTYTDFSDQNNQVFPV